MWHGYTLSNHKLVAVGSDWKWCSAARFRKTVSPAWLRTITSFKYDEIAAEGLGVKRHRSRLRVESGSKLPQSKA